MNQEIVNSIYFLIYSYFAHNYIFIAYALGLALCLGLSIFKPLRFLIILSIGFGFLCFAFQYEKHFALQVGNEIAGTISSKTDEISPNKINIITQVFLPILFYCVGWFMIFLAIILETFRKEKKNHHAKTKLVKI